MRTAVILLCLLALTAIPGSVLPQRGVASDPFAVVQFMEENPGISPWLDRLSLFNVYSAPWFAAIYILLLVSMTGCVLPRCLRLWRNVRAQPPATPTNLGRLDGHRGVVVPGEAAAPALAGAAGLLRSRRFRVVATDTEVRAEKGYLRELGNLGFHLSLLLLLLGVAYGKLVGFEGRVVVVEGSTFTNSREQYDAFSPAALTDVSALTPFSVRLDDFTVEYETSGLQRGNPTAFDAKVTVTEGASGGQERTTTASPNNPINVDGTKLFVTGNGYAPVVSVRDATGEVVTSGPVVFLPDDLNYASTGVIKAPDAKPEGLAFEGRFLPTSTLGQDGPISAYPDLVNPELVLTAYRGDLGLDRPQSVFSLDMSGLKQLSGKRPLILAPGDTVELPDGRGSITFDRVARFVNFQVAYDPGKEISLAAAILLLLGLTMSLTIPRRRWWIRATPREDGLVQIEVGGLSLTRRELPGRDREQLDAWLASTADQPALQPTAAREGR
ncbi:cytochrome c biogenesis protein ResB [Nocardioides hungaricus]